MDIPIPIEVESGKITNEIDGVITALIIRYEGFDYFYDYKSYTIGSSFGVQFKNMGKKLPVGIQNFLEKELINFLDADTLEFNLAGKVTFYMF